MTIESPTGNNHPGIIYKSFEKVLPKPETLSAIADKAMKAAGPLLNASSTGYPPYQEKTVNMPVFGPELPQRQLLANVTVLANATNTTNYTVSTPENWLAYGIMNGIAFLSMIFISRKAFD